MQTQGSSQTLDVLQSWPNYTPRLLQKSIPHLIDSSLFCSETPEIRELESPDVRQRVLLCCIDAPVTVPTTLFCRTVKSVRYQLAGRQRVAVLKHAAVHSVQTKWTCHRGDMPAIRGTSSGAVAGGLQCLPGSIISPASHSLKMSYIHSNEL